MGVFLSPTVYPVKYLLDELYCWHSIELFIMQIIESV